MSFDELDNESPCLARELRSTVAPPIKSRQQAEITLSVKCLRPPVILHPVSDGTSTNPIRQGFACLIGTDKLEAVGFCHLIRTHIE